MKAQQTHQLLAQIATELQAIGLWSGQAPTAQALASTAPFCYDTMPFAQWLQFVFLPRMQALLDAGLALPTQISLCPMAEEAFKHLNNQALPLINRIAELDELLSGVRVQSVGRI